MTRRSAARGEPLWPAVGVALALAVAFPLAVPDHQVVKTALVNLALLLPFACVGALVVRRQPRNPVGWMLLAIAGCFAVSTDAGLYAVWRYLEGHQGLPLARLAVALAPLGWFSLLLILPLTVLLFPDGRLPSPRWRWPMFVYLAVWAAVLAAAAIADSRAFTSHRIQVDSSGGLTAFDNASGVFRDVTGVAVPLYGPLALSFVLAQVLAYRRSAGERRQQLKWLMVGAGLSVVGLTLTLTISNSSNGMLQAIGIAGFFASAAFPLAMGVAILKYRLYDVDRLISRTLSYTILTVLLGAVFLGIVLVATQVLPFSSPVGVAASTLAAAALFSPLRRRVQRAVDRRFNRARYDAEAIVSAFSSRLRGASDLEAVHAELLGAVHKAMEPAQASVWIQAAD
jgi:hypothetical protein